MAQRVLQWIVYIGCTEKALQPSEEPRDRVLSDRILVEFGFFIVLIVIALSANYWVQVTLDSSGRLTSVIGTIWN
jgi:hypothetical protein